MKTLRNFLFVAVVALAPLLSFGAANDLKISQQNSGGTAWIDRIFANGANGFIGTNSSGTPALLASGASQGAVLYFNGTTWTSLAAGSAGQFLVSAGAGANPAWGTGTSGALPSMTSNSGKILTNDGTNASWTSAVTVSGSNAAVAGNLTVSGTGTSSFAGMVSASVGNTRDGLTVTGSNSTDTIFYFSNTSSGGTPWQMRSNGGGSPGFGSTGSYILHNGTAGLVEVTSAGVVKSYATTSGTSTTAASILGKSIGLTENLIAGGTGTFGTANSASANTILGLKGSDAAGFGPYVRIEDATNVIGYVGSQNGVQGGSTRNLTITAANSLTLYTSTGTLAATFTGANTTLAGNLTVSGVLTVSTDTLSGAGAVSVTKDTTKVTSTGVGNALTLANGVDGQIKRIVHDVDGGSAILTPTTKTGFSTVTFTNAGDTVTLEYVTTRGWMVVGSYGVTIAP
jgi:hypothetical protein